MVTSDATPERREGVLPLDLAELRACGACVGRLRDALTYVRGVDEVQLDDGGGQLRVRFDAAAVPPERLATLARDLAAGLGARFRHERYRVTGMDCGDCARSIERGILALPGVASANVSFTAGALAVEYEPASADEDRIVGRVRELGFGIESDRPPSLPSASVAPAPAATAQRGPFIAWATPLVARVGARALGTALAALALLAAFAASAVDSPTGAMALAALSIVVGGYPIARSGLRALVVARVVDMNVLMTVAVLGAAVLGDWLEAASIVVLFSVGNTLEAATVERARGAIRSLIAVAPAEVRLRRDGIEMTLSAEHVRIGDVVRVRPGERVAADGVIVEGTSALDEAPITGESLPVDRGVGERVFAGSVNGTGYLEVRADRPFRETTIARIADLVESAQARRSPTERIVDRFSAYYTPAVLAIAAAIAVLPPFLTGAGFGDWAYRALVLLVIACPCALVISTPVAIVAAIARAARDGILFKGGEHLEALGRVRAIAIDKTGTLTIGQPAVVAVVPTTDLNDLGTPDSTPAERLLALAAAVESRSEHPLARAIVRAAQHDGLTPPSSFAFEALPGRGTRARIAPASGGLLLGGVLATGSHAEGGPTAMLASAATGSGIGGAAPAAGGGIGVAPAAGSVTPVKAIGAVERGTRGAAPEAAGRPVQGRSDLAGAFGSVDRAPGGRELGGAQTAVTVLVGSTAWLAAEGADLAPYAATIEAQEALGRTVLVVARRAAEPSILGIIALADTPREAARKAIASIRLAGIHHIAILTGDRRRAAEAIAGQVGIDDVHAELLPEQKLAVVQTMAAARPTAMVGDGINDAPALAAASVGIAMGRGGSAVAVEAADVALMSDDLALLPRAIGLSRAAVTTIRVNVAFALATKAVFVVLAASGVVGLWPAVLADVGTSVAVTLNAMRLLRRQPR